MKKEEIIKRLTAIKKEVTKLGMDSIASDFPIPLEKMIQDLNPFSNLEDAFTETIETINARKV
jgi:hypothetical protein